MVKILPVNDENDIPGTVVIVEIATVARPDEIYPDRTIHTFRCGHAISARMENGKWTREKSLAFTETTEFWSWINFVRRAGAPVTLFGSNVGQTLTLLGLWSLVTDGLFTLNRGAHPNLKNARSHKARAAMMRMTKGLLVTGGPPTALIIFHRDRWKLTILDTQNYLEKTASELAPLVGIENPVILRDDAPQTSIECSVSSKCRISAEFIRRLIVWHCKQELGRFSLTVTGIAMAAFRHRFMRDRIELPEEQDDRDWERCGYFNGRVEAFWAGTIRGNKFIPVRHIPHTGDLFEDRPVGPFHVVDARSFYAAVQTFQCLPVACVESHIDDHYGPPATDDSLEQVMAHVLIDSSGDTYPVRRDKGCIFAGGTFWTTLCGPELARAVRAGHVSQWASWKRYRLEQCLRWFAEGFWKERVAAEASGDKLIAALCKGIMARLHGKFLQRRPKWVNLPGRVPPGPWEHWTSVVGSTGDVRKFRSIGYDVQIQDDAGDDKFCFPALAAWVTSHGREYLRHWINVAGPRHTLYVATDSLIVDNTGLANLTKAGIIWPDGVGSLRVVRSHPDIEIRGPNNYTHDGRQVVSGRSHRALQFDGNRWQAERWQGLEETFLESDRTQVTSFAVQGNIDNCTVPGKVGPGGWLTPPMLTTVEEEKWQRLAAQHS